MPDIFLPYRYLACRLKARHRFGRGIHPPFACAFIREAFFGETPAGMEIVEEIRKAMHSDKRGRMTEEQGAGSRTAMEAKRSVRGLARHTAISRRYGKVLARMVRFLHPEMIIELGTGTGIASLYLHLACRGAGMSTCEGCRNIAGIARENFDKAGVTGIDLKAGKFESLLPGLLCRAGSDVFIFIDGDHREERLLQYFSMVIDSGIPSAVVVIDDINWSRGMNRAWNSIRKHPFVSLSLETFRMGILFIGRDVQKAHFVINY